LPLVTCGACFLPFTRAGWTVTVTEQVPIFFFVETLEPDFAQILEDFDAVATETFTVAFLGTVIESIFATDFAEYFLFFFTFADFTVATLSATLAVEVDALGVVFVCAVAAGVSDELEDDVELVPKLVVAVTAKLYAVPLLNPFTVHEVVELEQVNPPGVDVVV
jgi:hypothetical protein